ncbi:MAG: helix-turn-helix domain-containing protein [Halobacteria archaeon]|nr:helix-turn-helix domain-containing protein [Halobacteria archaeon]
MSVVAEISISEDGFTEDDPFLPPEGTRVELETTVHACDTLTPLVWVMEDTDGVEDEISRNPHVEEVESVKEFDEGALYHVSWDCDTVFLDGIRETNATILEGTAQEGCWHFRLHFESHDYLSEFYDYCEENGTDVEVEKVNEHIAPLPRDLPDLTERQSETLVKAHDEGYFDIPRGTTLVELAEEMDISDQAISERIRRALSRIIESQLIEEDGDEDRGRDREKAVDGGDDKERDTSES